MVTLGLTALKKKGEGARAAIKPFSADRLNMTKSFLLLFFKKEVLPFFPFSLQDLRIYSNESLFIRDGRFNTPWRFGH
jgi:hypothetical protein